MVFTVGQTVDWPAGGFRGVTVEWVHTSGLHAWVKTPGRGYLVPTKELEVRHAVGESAGRPGEPDALRPSA
jgi:hypothetical protein